MYIDSHAHLEGHKFDSDRAEMLTRAREAGLDRILAIGSGTGPGTYDCALKIAEQHDWIFASTGLHPHEASVATEADYEEMARLAKHPKLIAWGEIGLDYFYDHSPRDVQKEVFRRQMELAAAAKLPIIIHCRPSNNSENAWDDTLQMLARPLGAQRSAGDSPLLYRRMEACASRTGYRLLYFFCRQRQLSQGGKHPRSSKAGPARPHAD